MVGKEEEGKEEGKHGGEGGKEEEREGKETLPFPPHS